MKVQIHEHDPGWERAYNLEAVKVLDALAPLACKIEHVGSTAVRDIAAKPIIDILLGVDTLKSVELLIRRLGQVGYTHWVPDPDKDVRLFFIKRDERNQRRFHLHVAPIGEAYWKDMVAFRDLLRADFKTASEYVALKQMLAARFPHDLDAYTAGKTAFIHRALRKVR